MCAYMTVHVFQYVYCIALHCIATALSTIVRRCTSCQKKQHTEKWTTNAIIRLHLAEMGKRPSYEEGTP